MFDYNSSETILNSLYLPDGVTPQWKVWNAVADTSSPSTTTEDPFINYFGGSKALQVTRVAKYIDRFITQVWKNPYVAAVNEVQTLTVPSGGITANVIYRLSIDAILDQGSQSADYSRWAIHKGKPYSIEFTSSTTISNTTTAATTIVAALKKGLKNPDLGELDLTFDSSGANITVTTKNPYVHFKSIAIETMYTIGSGTGEDLEGDVKEYLCAFDASTATPAAGKAVISTPGQAGFGTYDWIIRNLRIPTVEAIRFQGTFQDELPRPGSNYTQFVIDYEKSREITGTNVVGAPATSKTKHTFYVLDTGASEAANPAYKFWTDIATTLGANAGDYMTVVTTAGLNSTLSATNDGILATTEDNLPL